LLKYLGSAFDDTLFQRVVMALWGLQFVLAFICSAFNYEDLCPDYWLFIFPAALGTLGAFLVQTVLLAKDETVVKRTEWLSEGGEWVGLIFIIVVVIIAIPIWELLRLWHSR
jgi:hypothetical protein